MESSRPYLNAELFEINRDELLTAVSDSNIYAYETYFLPKALALFETNWESLWHIVNLLQLEKIDSTVISEDNVGKVLTFSKEASDLYHAFFIDEPNYEIKLQPCTTAITSDNYSIIRTLVTNAIRSKIAHLMNIERNIAFDAKTDLTKRIPREIRDVSLLSEISAHIGFSFMVRSFGEKFYVQILPRSRITFNQTIADLLNRGYDNASIFEYFPYVHILGQGNARIIEICNETISDKLTVDPFHGRTFEQFASKMYPDCTSLPKMPLVKVASHRQSYFPADWISPSLSFTSIRNLDEQYYSELIGILKTQSKQRPQDSVHWAEKISKLQIGNNAVEVKHVPLAISYSPEKISPSFGWPSEYGQQGFVFKSPAITMLRYGDPVELIPNMGFQATVNDLLVHPELKPFDAPKEIDVIVIVHSQLTQDWNTLKQALVNGIRGYRGFADIFGTQINFKQEIILDNFNLQQIEAETTRIREHSYHCALVIIPRFFKTPEETRRVYTTLKTLMMTKGIPVQTVTDDKKTLNRNNTLIGKSRNPRVLFGLGINIMAKTGTILCALSENVANKLIPNSMILGYNVGRVYPFNMAGVKAIPLCAPLVIFDNRGAYVSHQNVVQLKNETSLFEEYGDLVFNQFPAEISTLIVHKDGYFSQYEIESLKQKASEYGINVVPISIRTGEIPRVSNPGYFGSDIGFEAGTVLPLSGKDFLMITTATGKWDAEKLGWPNPLLVTFHGKIESSLTLKALYQIYALTKMQTASQRAIRDPISIHFSNMITKFLRKVGDPAPTYLHYFVKGSKGSYLPRWFL